MSIIVNGKHQEELSESPCKLDAILTLGKVE
jgi:hypothetical protein